MGEVFERGKEVEFFNSERAVQQARKGGANMDALDHEDYCLFK